MGVCCESVSYRNKLSIDELDSTSVEHSVSAAPLLILTQDLLVQAGDGTGIALVLIVLDGSLLHVLLDSRNLLVDHLLHGLLKGGGDLVADVGEIDIDGGRHVACVQGQRSV